MSHGGKRPGAGRPSRSGSQKVKMPHGGKRPGAGRPSGSGLWKEETALMRVPLSLKAGVGMYVEKRGYNIPLYSSRIPAGPPSMAVDDIEAMVNLNSILLKNPESCFLLKVSGDSMIKAGIHDGDILIVNRKLEVTNGAIVAAMIDGEATVKRFKKDASGAVTLLPENDSYAPIVISENQNLEIAGVVTNVIHRLCH